MKVTGVRRLGLSAAVVAMCLLCPPVAIAIDIDGWYPILNGKCSYPQDWSAEVGAYIGDRRDGEWGTSVTGAFVSLEPGINGIKINAGYGNGGLLLGFRFGASYYQVWQSDHGIDRGTKFIGLQASGTAWWFTASIGGYYDPEESRTLLSAGIGVGW